MNKNKELKNKELNNVQGGYALPRASKNAIPNVKEIDIKVAYPPQVEQKDNKDIKNTEVWTIE